MRRIELKFNIKVAVLIISSSMIFAIYNINNYTNLKNEKSIICTKRYECRGGREGFAVPFE